MKEEMTMTNRVMEGVEEGEVEEQSMLPLLLLLSPSLASSLPCVVPGPVGEVSGDSWIEIVLVDRL